MLHQASLLYCAAALLLGLPYLTSAQSSLLICADDDPARHPVIDAYLHDFKTYFEIEGAVVLAESGSTYRSDAAEVRNYGELSALIGQVQDILCTSEGPVHMIMLFEPGEGPAPPSLAGAMNACQGPVKMLSNNFCVTQLGEICSHLTTPSRLTTFSYDDGAVEPLLITAMDQGVVIGRPWWPYVVIPVATVPTIILLTGDDTPADPCANDRPPSILTQPQSFTSVCFDPSGFQNWLSARGGSEASDEASVVWTHDFTGIPACGMSGSVTFTATDPCGNTATTSASYSLGGNAGPALLNPAEDRVACNAGEEFTAWLADNGGARVSDECGPVTWSADINGVPTDCQGSAMVVFTATDACGNQVTTQAQYRVEDLAPPELLQTASDLILDCPDKAGPEVTDWLNSHGGATADDNCGPVTWTHDFAGKPTCTTEQTVTFTATDACGNQVSTSATLSVQDDVPPVIGTEAADEEVACLTGNEFTNWLTANGGAQANDNCGTVIWSHDHQGTLEDCDQTAIVTFTATDACGNTATTQASFRVNDEMAPTLGTAASDLSLGCASDPQLDTWLASNGGASVSDNCGSVTWTNDFDTGEPECSTPVVVTFTATDLCGNSTTTQGTVELNDATPPAVTTPAEDLTTSCEGGPDLDAWIAINGGATATDECGTVAWSNDWDPASLQCNTSTVVTFTATDACGNTATTQASVSVEDDAAPVIDPGASDFFSECEGGAAFDTWLENLGGAAATDNCGEVTWTNDFTGPLGICDENLVITFTATDACGNTATTQALVQVQDVVPPEIVVGAETEIVVCGSFAEFQDWLDNNGGAEATDSCGTVLWANDYGGGPPDCNNETLVTFIATDGCGNTATTIGGFTIEDMVPPETAGVPPDVAAPCDAIPDTAVVEAFDDCGQVSLVFSENTSPGCPYDITRTWTATDDCGNITVSEQIISVTDDEPPFPVEVPPNQEIDCPPPCSECSFPPPPPVLFGDNCDPDPEIFVEVVTEGSLPGVARAQYFYQAVDDCGNASEVIVVEILMSCFKGDPTVAQPTWEFSVSSPSSPPSSLLRHAVGAWQDWGLTPGNQSYLPLQQWIPGHRMTLSRRISRTLSSLTAVNVLHARQFAPGHIPSGTFNFIAAHSMLEWKIPNVEYLSLSTGINHIQGLQDGLRSLTWPQLRGAWIIPIDNAGTIESAASFHLAPIGHHPQTSSALIWEIRIRLGLSGTTVNTP